MNIRTSYRHTLYASYPGYVTQAVVNNFAPLLLLTFREHVGYLAVPPGNTGVREFRHPTAG